MQGQHQLQGEFPVLIDGMSQFIAEADTSAIRHHPLIRSAVADGFACILGGASAEATKFLEQTSNSTIVGYYFPTALQEFDIDSQRKRVMDLPKLDKLGLCLSGPFEIIYSLICYPKLLFDKQNYSPILCASSLEHKDPRMVMLLKSYGPHLEFWLMSQMLTPEKTQVSEQWSGGITIYTCL